MAKPINEKAMVVSSAVTNWIAFLRHAIAYVILQALHTLAWVLRQLRFFAIIDIYQLIAI